MVLLAMRLTVLIVLLLLTACSAAQPVWSGGSTTPTKRSDITLGTAVRIPTGALRDPLSSEVRRAQRGGVSPVGAFRVGLPQSWDLGFVVSGLSLRADIRKEWALNDQINRPAIIIGISPLAGFIPDKDGVGSGAYFGATIPVSYSIDFGGIYETWVGVLVGGQALRGEFLVRDSLRSVSAFILNVGGMVGFAIGFNSARRGALQAFAEARIEYEHWFGSHEDVSLNRGGLVITPSFGLRIRI